MNFAKKLMLITVLITALFSANAFADGFSASVGADYNTGKYGTRDSTDVYYMPFQLSYDAGPMSYKLTVPYIRVTGPGDVVPAGLGGSGGGSTAASSSVNCSNNSGKGNVSSRPECNGVVANTTTATSTKRKRATESGLGDIVAAATYNVVDNPDTGWIIDLTGKVKFPTASDSRGLGTGETDYAVQANVDKYFGAPYVSAGLGYRWLGEPRGADFRNVTYGSLGGGYKFSQAASMGGSYDWSTSAIKNGAKPQEVSVYGSYRINDHYKLSAVLYGGLSNASPDVGGGFTLSYYF